jgi:hypothetical protein
MFIFFNYLLAEIDASRVTRVIVKANRAAWTVIDASQVARVIVEASRVAWVVVDAIWVKWASSIPSESSEP